MLCPACWLLAAPAKRLRGSPALELVLWLLLLLPGALYAWWRHWHSYRVCSQCGSESVLAENSPEAAMLLASQPNAPLTSLPAIERVSRFVGAVPFAGGVGFVLAFALSLLFPGVRDDWWFWLLAWAAVIALVLHPVWTVIHFSLRRFAEDEQRENKKGGV